MAARRLSYEEAERVVAVYNECVAEGYVKSGGGRGNYSAKAETSRRIGLDLNTTNHRLRVAVERYGFKLDEYVKPAFTFDEVPHDGAETAEELIEKLKTSFVKKKAHDDAKRLMDVRINYDGPIGIVFFGDPHVDSSGTNWPALERDVAICRDTPGIFAVSVGDARDNWIGRLMSLYANAPVTAKQSLVLIEWLFTQLPWLLTVGGNHDRWGETHGDAAEIIHRLRKCGGLYENDGARLRLNLPNGANFNMHVRHDFPGSSIFNGAHALVRETLHGYRDHVLACGHRHSSAYQPIWHNDPQRLCQGFRCGSYKFIDAFQKEKHFKEENWAPSMGVVVNPDLAHDPVRFIERCFSAEEVADKLTWARMKWERGRVPS